ncbi:MULTISPECIES: hypothetical protein [Sphingomonas]|uniref:hypothetical protein n=1 Tax=Sphingomonas TaxID=13687 RepID=UPI0031DC43B5
MRLLRMIPTSQICAVLCIALTLVFAGASLSRSIDQIQHAPGASPIHEHLVFSDISLDDAHDLELDHDGDHHEVDHNEPDDSDSSDHLPGSHHHHGDSGSGLIVLASTGAAEAALADDAPNAVPDRPAIGFKVQGPERPPKPSTISA